MCLKALILQAKYYLISRNLFTSTTYLSQAHFVRKGALRSIDICLIIYLNPSKVLWYTYSVQGKSLYKYLKKNTARNLLVFQVTFNLDTTFIIKWHYPISFSQSFLQEREWEKKGERAVPKVTDFNPSFLIIYL